MSDGGQILSDEMAEIIARAMAWLSAWEGAGVL